MILVVSVLKHGIRIFYNIVTNLFYPFIRYTNYLYSPNIG